ncbi:MAG: hypothetical protein ACOVP4_07295 [Bacteriovoracaceae bacterium]
MKLFSLFSLITLTVSCGRTHHAGPVGDVANNNGQNIVTEIIDDFSYPGPNQLQYQGQTIADLSVTSATLTPTGEFQPGRTLNVLTIRERDFLVYGEDGVFATECEPHADYPDHGPTHPLCEVAHGESFDKIIICFSTVSTTPILTAQNWPGSVTAMTDSNLGMECWVNGVKMKSNKIFTY